MATSGPLGRLVDWFTGKRKLILELQSLRKQYEECRSNLEMVEKSAERWKRRSDDMDLLGDSSQFEKLLNYGSIESILNLLEEYQSLKEKASLDGEKSEDYLRDKSFI